MHPLSWLRHPTLKEGLWLNAMAAVAVGMFVGAWILGPAISTGPSESTKLRSAQEEKAALANTAARPDPSPYRSATPAFDVPDAPAFGKLAKERAQAALERGVPLDDEVDRQRRDWSFRGSGNYRQVDRHTGVRY
jgi:hypothetical protein